MNWSTYFVQSFRLCNFDVSFGGIESVDVRVTVLGQILGHDPDAAGHVDDPDISIQIEFQKNVGNRRPLFDSLIVWLNHFQN